MTALLDREAAVPAPVQINELHDALLVEPYFLPPESQVGFDPNIFKKIQDFGASGIPYCVPVLDEQVIYTSDDGNTIRIRQYLLGHHSSPLLRNAVLHQGWQGPEMIREYYRVRMEFGNGRVKIATREIDLNEGRWTPDVERCTRAGEAIR